MNRDGHLIEWIKTVDMAREGVNYEDIEGLRMVVRRTKNNNGDVIETVKRPRTINMTAMPQKPEERMKNGEAISKVHENRAYSKIRNSNRNLTNSNDNLTKIHRSVPLIYYVMVVFGLASAISGALLVASYPVYYSVVVGGIGVSLVAFIGILEVLYKRGKLGTSS